ncbi:MAG TPA: tyrosine-type recombinase/integrase [Methylomusa anaerophila]|uniref:Tyrosine recombinase XerD n=1 Tax=Methylomusa anaerophila TaxID=1930071 RepID=A0A348AIT5_9FIRM|nr:tyrosine-type recombinase/integrase [Methylomusa anaerophila]BBB90983.1 tyrosine recombinase XerD [Methylomusa anaerophila]HML88855.1 tyrosine-type recombinase/integrase [Methylomusa anaerophila]
MNEKSTRFFKLVRDFLTVYLPDQKAVSVNTVKSYRECLNQLLRYICDRNGISLGKLNFERLSKETVENYLGYLEKERDCSVSTRNHRLACIRSFVKYAGARDIGVQAYVKDLCTIPLKRAAKTTVIKFFSEAALKTILEQPDTRKKKELRNLFFMILMYDTGARNQELLDLKLSDIHFEGKSPYVVITGKGRKTRLVPVMPKTVDHFRKYAAVFHPEHTSDDYLFYTERKGRRFAMSPDNTERFIKKYGVAAHNMNPEVPESLHCHMFRHSRSMHLYRSGMPMVLLAEWLGHAQISSTLIYANADTEMKKEAIQKVTSKLNPLVSGETTYLEWEDDEELIRQLYGLSR